VWASLPPLSLPLPRHCCMVGGTAGGASSPVEVVGTRGWLVIKKEGEGDVP